MNHQPLTVVAETVVVESAAKRAFPKLTLLSLLRRVSYVRAVSVSFVVGCALLMMYLMSIGYVPPDLLSLFGLATLVSAWLAALWAFVTVALFAPVFTVLLYEIEAPRPKIMITGQASGTLLLLSLMPFTQPYALYMLVLGVVGAVGSLMWHVRDQPKIGLDKRALTVAAMILGGAGIPLGVLLVVLTGGITKWPGELALGAGTALLVALHAANAYVARLKAPPVVIWIVSGLIAALVFLIAAGWQSVATTLAERVGIRLAGTSTLLVPEATCRLLAVGVSLHQPSAKPPLENTCSATASVLKASVELRWSGRLLLVVHQLNGIDVPAGAARMTIPEEGTQLLLRPHKD